jgi:APA family basic amino acid/polyamine antiporter
VNAIMMIGTRILFAMGRDGLIWRRTASVNARGTPTVATLVTTVVAIALVTTGTFQKLVGVASFFLAANYCVSCLALVVLRRREPLLARPFRATRTALLAMGLMAAGLVGSRAFAAWIK